MRLNKVKLWSNYFKGTLSAVLEMATFYWGNHTWVGWIWSEIKMITKNVFLHSLFYTQINASQVHSCTIM